MRAGLILTVVLIFASSIAAAQTPPAFPPGAEAREAQLMTRIGPQARAWIRQEAVREANLRDVSETTAATAVRSNAAVLGNLSNADIEALTFIVMMEAAKSAQEDVKAIMAQMKQVNDSKAALRQSNTNSRAAIASVRSTDPSNTISVARPLANSGAVTNNRAVAINRAAITPRPRPKAEFDSQLDRVKNDLDSMNEMGEMESLRLQMAMDRMSKMMSTLSNLLKKTSDTAAGITQNIK